MIEARAIYTAAQETGRLLLALPPDDRYPACEWLVKHGYARWFEKGKTPYYPGIELTGKKWAAGDGG